MQHLQREETVQTERRGQPRVVSEEGSRQVSVASVVSDHAEDSLRSRRVRTHRTAAAALVAGAVDEQLHVQQPQPHRRLHKGGREARVARRVLANVQQRIQLDDPPRHRLIHRRVRAEWHPRQRAAAAARGEARSLELEVALERRSPPQSIGRRRLVVDVSGGHAPPAAPLELGKQHARADVVYGPINEGVVRVRLAKLRGELVQLRSQRGPRRQRRVQRRRQQPIVEVDALVERAGASDHDPRQHQHEQRPKQQCQRSPREQRRRVAPPGERRCEEPATCKQAHLVGEVEHKVAICRRGVGGGRERPPDGRARQWNCRLVSEDCDAHLGRQCI